VVVVAVVIEAAAAVVVAVAVVAMVIAVEAEATVGIYPVPSKRGHFEHDLSDKNVVSRFRARRRGQLRRSIRRYGRHFKRSL
jgi:hypothetical protein